jgi:hypothetical protein
LVFGRQFRCAEIAGALATGKYLSRQAGDRAKKDSARGARPLAVFLLPSVRNSYDMSRNRPAKGREKCVKP